VAKRWAEHNGEPRIRESMKIPRKIVRRRRTHNKQRYQLLVGASCEIDKLTAGQINDLVSVEPYLKVSVVKDAPKAKPYVVGF
jgi:hypothetical protein